ncbi:MAG: RNA polymerase sigma factor [Bacteroidaceae bacterium]|nr:RNA polymerase sigma factor [Bacteroidaceae bacterium]
MTREEFTTFVKAEQEQLRRYLLALCCGNRDEADDIAQESLVKAYLSADTYTDSGRFAAWLYRIAHRTFLDHCRRRRRTSPLETAAEQTSGERSDEKFRYQELYLALDQLPAGERSSLLLFYIKGYTIHEISQITESSEDAVKKQLSRGRDHLKERITR